MAARKIDLMHQQFGVCDGHACRECRNFVSGDYHGKTLRKCKVYGLTHSEASDWAGRWLACGMFNREYTGRPVIELVQRGRREPKPTEGPLDGQISMMEVTYESKE